MQIRPTLFVGLGTSGINMIKEFRLLMFEQFGQAGLPIFAYMGIETNKDYPEDDPRLPPNKVLRPYEQLSVTQATVAKANDVRVRLDPEQRLYNAQLARWFDPSLLTDKFSIQSGAGHVRMLGRVALWMNWPEIGPKLAAIQQDLMNPDRNKAEETLKILKEKLPGSKTPPSFMDGYDVYILGTLCGGTCGGMIVDMAYQIQNAFHAEGIRDSGRGGPHYYAIVTVLDSYLAKDRRVQAANCWASLMELDYFQDPNTTYDFLMPGERVAFSTKSPPFVNIHLVSRTNKENQYFPLTGSSFKEEPMNKMIALKMFNGIFMGMGSKINEESINLMSLAKTEGSTVGIDKDRYTRSFTSFGLSALWNPKYRSAQAYTCRMGAEFCGKLVGKLDAARETELKDAAKQAWNKIWDEAEAILTRDSVAGVDLERKRHFAQVDRLRLSDQPGAMGELIKTLQRQDFGERFIGDGDLRRLLRSKVQEYERYLQNELQSLVDKKLDSVGDLDPGLETSSSFRILNFQELKQFILHLEEAVVSSGGGVSTAEPQLKVSLRDPLPQEEKKGLIGSIFSSKKEEEEKHAKAAEHVIKSYKEQVVRFVDAYQAWVARPNLEKFAEGVREKAFTTIDGTIGKLTETFKMLADEYQKAKSGGTQDYYNVIEVSDGSGKGVESNVKKLKGTFDSMEPVDRKLVIGRILSEWNRKDGKEDTLMKWRDLFGTSDAKALAGLFKGPFFQWALEQRDSRDLCKEAVDMFGNNPMPIGQLNDMSAPYFEVHEGYLQMPDVPHPINYLCGGTPESREALIQMIRSHSGKSQLPRDYLDSPLENFVVFYKEEPPFFMYDLGVSTLLKTFYEERKSEGAIQHSHRDPDFYSKTFMTHYDSILETFQIIQSLYPDEAFQMTAGHLVFVYRDPERDRKVTLYVYDEEEKEGEEGTKFCREIASNPHARNAFDLKIQDLLTGKGTKEDAEERWEAFKDNELEGFPKSEIMMWEEKFYRVIEGPFKRASAGPRVVTKAVGRESNVRKLPIRKRSNS